MDAVGRVLTENVMTSALKSRNQEHQQLDKLRAASQFPCARRRVGSGMPDMTRDK